ncbi:unnamed protein product [Bemisia tabaci]|uniref:Uncharacterized protein n=1 Tax=Bemisia tabaci TaxID=7038 RepID=A0A9P0AM44_BEMTA|nr:unnamed protein product [Bemisia tabaci]
MQKSAAISTPLVSSGLLFQFQFLPQVWLIRRIPEELDSSNKFCTPVAVLSLRCAIYFIYIHHNLSLSSTWFPKRRESSVDASSDHNGSKPLHITAKYGYEDIISALLEKKRSVNSIDSDGCTPLWIALDNNQVKSVQVLLKDFRVNVNFRFNHRTPLGYATQEGNSTISKLLIERNADINIIDNDRLTLLHYAIRKGLLDVVDHLLNRGASVHSKTKRGNTPLHIASMDGGLEIAKLLIDKGADVHVNCENSYKASCKGVPLQLAVKGCHLKMARFLIQKGADINATDPHTHYTIKKGGTLLHWAVREYDLNFQEELIRFLKENGADVNSAAYDGRTPLCLLVKHHGYLDIVRRIPTFATSPHLNSFLDITSSTTHFLTTYRVEKGFIELTKELIDAKSNINALASDETTPFSIAAENGNSILIELLLEQSNLDVSRSYHGKTTLHIASEKGHTDVLKALLADHRCTHYVNMKDSSGKTPVHIAVEYGRTNILSNLLEKTHDVNAVDKNGCTPLWIAIEKNQEKCAQILLEDERVDVKTRHFSQTPLERALKEKNTNISKLIIDRVGDTEIRDEDGLNPLHRAVDEGMLDVIDYLIKKGANIQSKTKNGNTPLHVAARRGNLEVAKFLVNNGADIHARSENYHNCTPLQCAVMCSKLEVAKFLISVGSDINAHYPCAHFSIDRGGTLLHWASRKMDEEELIRFLVENGADVNATEYGGRTPLCLLVKHRGSFAVMRYLIEKGATLNNERGGTPLYWAFSVDYYGHPKAADFLIEMGTDVNSCIDYHGYEWDQMRTALHLARHLSTVNLLIDKGANVNAMDKSLNTPLHLARTPSIAKCLLEHGAKVNASNILGDTPLHFVQNFHTAKILIEKGGNVNASNNEGYTPLHTARNTAIAKLLLDNGAELKAVTKDGKTVVHTSAEVDVFSHSQYLDVPEVVEFFLQKGIDVNVTDNSGNTPLHCCGTSDNIQVAAVLIEKGANTRVLNKSNKTPVECAQFFDSGGGTFCRMLHTIDKIFTAIIDNEGMKRIRRLLREVKTINLTQDDS